MGKRVFANYYFEVKFGQGAKANKYLEEIKAGALKLGIADVHMGKVEIGDNAPYIYFSLIFESADAFALIIVSAESALATATLRLPSEIAAIACCSDASACWIAFVFAIIASCNVSGGVIFVLN